MYRPCPSGSKRNNLHCPLVARDLVVDNAEYHVIEIKIVVPEILGRNYPCQWCIAKTAPGFGRHPLGTLGDIHAQGLCALDTFECPGEIALTVNLGIHPIVCRCRGVDLHTGTCGHVPVMAGVETTEMSDEIPCVLLVCVRCKVCFRAARCQHGGEGQSCDERSPHKITVFHLC